MFFKSNLDYKFLSWRLVEYSPNNIAWTATQELIWSEPEYKIGFNVSWSVNPVDHFGILFHLNKESLFENSLNAYVSISIFIIYVSQKLSSITDFSYFSHSKYTTNKFFLEGG